MCSRFYATDEVDGKELREIIAEVNRRVSASAPVEVKTHGEVFPTDVVPVLTAEGPAAMGWGFVRWDRKGIVINARSEDLLARPMFREPARTARCLIPGAYYFEWEHKGKERTKYRIGQAGTSLMYMAAVYRWEPGRALPVFSIVTREAAPGIAFIHDRMPVLFAKEAREAWLALDARVETVLQAAELSVRWQAEGGEQISLFNR